MRYPGVGWAPNPYDWYLSKGEKSGPREVYGENALGDENGSQQAQDRGLEQIFPSRLEGFKPGLASDQLSKGHGTHPGTAGESGK